MRYKLDADGYVSAVAFGCYLNNCKEYNGEIPAGYSTLDDWATNACINAYYLDAAGNLVLDSERLAEIRQQEKQDALDYAPVLRKDLYASNEVINGQYKKKTQTGEVLVLKNIKTLAPKVKITGFNPYPGRKIAIYTQGKQMMPCNAVAKTEAGVSFTKNTAGAISIRGTSTQDIEYTISGSSENSTPLFALKANHNYYLNLGGLECELRYFDGETTAQVYVGPSGLLNLPQSIEVTEVVVKIPGAQVVDVTFYPQLEYGNAFTYYETHKSKVLVIDFSEQYPASLYPGNTLYASETLYVGVPTEVLDYIMIKEGIVYVSVDGVERIVAAGVVGLYGSYNTIYALKDSTLEVEYSTNVYDVESLEFLQGKATTTNKFKILDDGSIEAHNGYFSGKIEANSGYFKGEIKGGTIEIGSDFSVSSTGKMVAKDAEINGKITSESGKIGGFNIGSRSLSTMTAPSLGFTGVYIGTDGLSCASSGRSAIIKSDGSAEFETADGIKVHSGTSNYTYITSNGIKVKNSTYTDTTYKDKEISCGSSFTIESSGLTLDVMSTGTRKITLQASSALVYADFSSTTSYVYGGNTGLSLGKSGKSIGFFGGTGSAKKTVSNISSTSSATASTIATKLNDLLTALRAYGLIG